MPRNHKSMEHANHMRETFHPCPPDEKSVSGAKLWRLHIFSFMFLRCFSMLHVFRSRMFSCDEFSLCSCFILICFVCVCELYMTIWIRYVCLCWITPCYAVCGVRAMPLCEGQGLFIRLQLDVSNSCL